MTVSASSSCPGNHFSTNVSATTSLAFSAMTAASNGASGGSAGWGYRSLASSASDRRYPVKTGACAPPLRDFAVAGERWDMVGSARCCPRSADWRDRRSITDFLTFATMNWTEVVDFGRLSAFEKRPFLLGLDG